MTHAPTRIGYVAMITRDDVHVDMGHRLPGGIASIEADVVSIRPGLQSLVQQHFDLIDKTHQRRLFLGRGVKPRGRQPPRDHQRVSFTDRKSIEDSKRKAVAGDPFGGWQ
jgi:hypothetical protein